MELLHRLRSEFRVKRAVNKVYPHDKRAGIIKVLDLTANVKAGKFYPNTENNLLAEPERQGVNRQNARRLIFSIHPEWRKNAPRTRVIEKRLRDSLAATK